MTRIATYAVAASALAAVVLPLDTAILVWLLAAGLLMLALAARELERR